MKLRELIKVLEPETVVAIIDGDSDIKVVNISRLDNDLKERQVHMVSRASSDNIYDLYIELKN